MGEESSFNIGASGDFKTIWGHSGSFDGVSRVVKRAQNLIVLFAKLRSPFQNQIFLFAKLRKPQFHKLRNLRKLRIRHLESTFDRPSFSKKISNIIIFATFAVATFLKIKLGCIAIASDTHKTELCYLWNCVFSQSQFAILTIFAIHFKTLGIIDLFFRNFGLFRGETVNFGSKMNLEF